MHARQVLADDEHLSTRWPEVRRHVSFYTDTDGRAAVLVAFILKNHRGNVDLTRAYRGLLGPAADVPDPVSAVGGFEAVAQLVEDTYAGKLEQFYGGLGAGQPVSWHAH
jgi:hypothetical protein